MKALWTKFAIPVCMPPGISERHAQRHAQRTAHRREDESDSTNGNRIRRSNRNESGISQTDETMH